MQDGENHTAKQLGNKTAWQIANPEFRDFIKKVMDKVEEKHTPSVVICKLSGVFDNEISYPLLLGATFYLYGTMVAISYGTEGHGNKGYVKVHFANYKRNNITKEERHELNRANTTARSIISHCTSDM